MSDFKFNLTDRKEDAKGVWGKTEAYINHYLTYSVVQEELVKEANLYSDINLSSFKDVLIKSDTEEKGKVVFKKIEGDVIKPKLNIVIVNNDGNDMKHPAIGDNYDKMIKDLNKIYYVSGIEWSLKSIIRIKNPKKGKGEKENVKNIMGSFKPEATEYYMIVYPDEMDNGAYGFITKGSNYFAISSGKVEEDIEANYNIVIQCIAHELGHCAGLGEFAIDYGNAKYDNYEQNPMTKNTTNVMGYNQGYQLDFNVDQVNEMRKNVNSRVSQNKNSRPSTSPQRAASEP